MSEPIIDRWTPLIDKLMNDQLIPQFEKIMAERFGAHWDDDGALTKVADDMLPWLAANVRVVIESTIAEEVDKFVDSRPDRIR